MGMADWLETCQSGGDVQPDTDGELLELAEKLLLYCRAVTICGKGDGAEGRDDSRWFDGYG
jgi:hypothetical protein